MRYMQAIDGSENCKSNTRVRQHRKRKQAWRMHQRTTRSPRHTSNGHLFKACEVVRVAMMQPACASARYRPKLSMILLFDAVALRQNQCLYSVFFSTTAQCTRQTQCLRLLFRTQCSSLHFKTQCLSLLSRTHCSRTLCLKIIHEP